MSKSYYQCLLFKQFTTRYERHVQQQQMSKSYYQCLLFKQFTTLGNSLQGLLRCQRAIINVYFSSNSQQRPLPRPATYRCQRAIINVYFSSNSQLVVYDVEKLRDVKELLSMFTFQAIHNGVLRRDCPRGDVKELLSMFTFQAIHNLLMV